VNCHIIVIPTELNAIIIESFGVTPGFARGETFIFLTSTLHIELYAEKFHRCCNIHFLQNHLQNTLQFLNEIPR
jgi:hypothetical protein